MEQQENVLKRGTSKAVSQRTTLNVILSLIFLGVGAALIVALLKCRADMNLGTRISCIVSFAISCGLGVWCLIDLFYGASQAGHIKKENKLMVTPEDMSNYKVSKNAKTSLFWTIMTIVLLVPAIAGAVFMLVSDKGEAINALYMAPAFILGILTLYLAIRKKCKMTMIASAISENLVEDQEVPAQETQELTPEQLREQQIAEAQRRAAEVLAQQQEQTQQEALQQQALAQQEEIRQRVLAQQEAARAALQGTATEPVALDVEKVEETPIVEPVEEPVTMTVQETLEPVVEPVEEVNTPVLESVEQKPVVESIETGESIAEPVEEPVAMEEPAVEPVTEQAPEEIKTEEIPVGEPPVEADEFELPELEFDIPFEELRTNEKPQPAPVQPAPVAPTIQIIFVTPNQNGQIPAMTPLNIPLQTVNGTQTIQLVMGPNNQPTSALLLPEGQTVETPKKTRGRKPGSKNSTTKKKSTAKRKTTRKSTIRTRTVKKVVEPEEPVEEVQKNDAVSSALDSIGAKLDKISKELSK